VKYFITILMVAAAEFEGGEIWQRMSATGCSQPPAMEHYEAKILPRRCIDRPDNPGYWSRCLGEWHGAPDMLGLYYRQSAIRGNLPGLLHGIPIFLERAAHVNTASGHRGYE
jgi:hypothetical protein